MRIQISNEYPLVHQIAFSDKPQQFTPNKDSVSIKESFGSENYRLWNLESTTVFLGENYEKDILKAFNRIKPFSFKANLARYCILNHFGGVYADLSIGKVKGFDASNFDMIVFRDGNSDKTSWKVATAFFFSKPHSLVLQDSIEEITSNVSRKFYGHDPHFVGGPSVFGRSIAKHGLDCNLLVGQYYWHKHRRNKYVLPGEKVVARGKVGGKFQGGNSGIAGGNNYNAIWQEWNVYGEKD
jgi:hypothetical protein